MANYENARDLKQEVLRHSGELTDGTSEYDEDVMIFLNRAYQGLLSGAAELGIDVGQSWSWGKNPYPSTLIITPTIQTAIISATYGSPTISFIGVPAVSYQNYYININNGAEVYRIKSHAAGSLTATIDSIFIGGTGSGFATKLMKYDYQLDPGILRLVGPFSTPINYNLSWSGKIELIEEQTFSRDYPMSIRQGVPDKATQIFKSSDMQPTVRFNRIPAVGDPLVRVEYNYIPVPDDLIDDVNSIPVIPRDHRITLCYYAAYFLLMDKNDNRAAEYRQLAIAGITAMVRASKIEKANTDENYGRIIARSDGGNNRVGRRWGWGSY